MIYRLALLAGAAPNAFDNDGYQATPADVNAVKMARANGNIQSSDPLLNRGSDSAHMLDYWNKTDAIIDGIDGMRASGDKYLPRFTDEDTREYEFRLKLSKMTNVFRDIVEDLSSKPFQEECEIVDDDNNIVPTELDEFSEDVDGSGNNLTVFANATFFNGIANAVDWIFIDYPKRDSNIVNQAQAKAAGMRPNWSHVLGCNILDAKSQVVNGEETLIYVKIYEPGEPDHVREFERLENGVVVWRLWEKSNKTGPDGKTQFIEVDSGDISIGVIPLVPFATGRRNGKRFCWLPALRDAADLQIELFQMESGLKFAKTLTAYPMLAANGIKPIMEPDGKTPKKIAVGPNRVLYAPPDGSGKIGKWEYLEPSAESLKFLADDIKETIQQLRELGRQPLTAQSGNMTVITSAVAASKSNSAVKQWALALKDALENAVVITCLWLDISIDAYDPTVSVFTEFDNWTDGKDVEAITTARNNKDISRETYWFELRRRGILSPEFDAETEEERLLDEVPGDGVDTVLDGPGDPGMNDDT
jgi:hypothetical protein